eukprot:Sdes_comp20693_c0_seq1m16262
MSGSSNPSELSQAEISRKLFELSNDIVTVENTDSLYIYNQQEQQKIVASKPWTKDPHYFKSVKISALALLKMVMHARAGGKIEVMGLMQGKIDGDVMYVMDSFALPVEGTETRVNAQVEGYEYMVQYMTSAIQVGRAENAIGWYHSHPAYGCWLSGIDVGTQMLNQQFQEPFVAVVIDPVRTVSAGKVNIGAFRTYPQGYKAPDESGPEYKSIPIHKIEDFGVHCKHYYSLDVSYFKSELDGKLFEQLWNKYWISTLASSPILNHQDYCVSQMNDLAEKLERCCSSSSHSVHSNLQSSDVKSDKNIPETQLQKVTHDRSVFFYASR